MRIISRIVHCLIPKHKQTISGTAQQPFELSYDKMHRLTKEQYPDSANPKTEYFEYKYDNAGRRIEMTDPTYGRAGNNPKPTRWAYDEDGKLIRVSRSVDGDYHRSDGEDYHVEYDNHARISRVLYPGIDNQPVMELEYVYSDAGQVAKIIARDLTQGASTDIYCMEYWYDTNGRKVRQVVKEKESDADTDAYYVTTFAYDSRDMLVEEKLVRWNSGSTQWDVMYWARYKYDTAGNMVYRNVDQIVNGSAKYYVDTLSYSRGYQLTLLVRSDPAAAESIIYTPTHDNNGNLTHLAPSGTFTDSFYNITEMEFQYDKKNRMTNYRFGGSGNYYEIRYDSLGRVRSRLTNAGTPVETKYYYDGRQLVQQLSSSNVVQFDYARGATGLDRQLEVSGTKKRFYLKDPLGTVWAMINPSTLAVIHYNYNAWGEHLDAGDTDFPTDNNSMRYIGCRVEAFGNATAQTDAIYHCEYRHYLPVLGLFLQRDLISLSKNVKFNPYCYADQAPSLSSDPKGLCPGSGCQGGGSFPSGQELWPGGHEPLPYDPSEIGGSGSNQPTYGEGDCCRLHWWVALNLDGPFGRYNRLPWISEFITTGSGGGIFEDEVELKYEYSKIEGYYDRKFICKFKVFSYFFKWYCDYKLACPPKRLDPCYHPGYLQDIGKWIGSMDNVGFYWQNSGLYGNRAVTRNLTRVEYIQCIEKGFIDQTPDDISAKLGFDQSGSVPVKNFCVNEPCACASTATLDLGAALLKGVADIGLAILFHVYKGPEIWAVPGAPPRDPYAPIPASMGL